MEFWKKDTIRKKKKPQTRQKTSQTNNKQQQQQSRENTKIIWNPENSLAFIFRYEQPPRSALEISLQEEYFNYILFPSYLTRKL